MKHHILLTALSLSVVALTACSGAEAPSTTMTEKAAVQTDAAASMDAKTKAVLVYADWCGSCKVLDPKIKAAQAMGPISGLEFVTLDYTNKDANAFYAQAEAAGVGPAITAHLGGTVKTGQLLLVDIDDQIVRGTVTKTLEPNEIVLALRDALAAS